MDTPPLTGVRGPNIGDSSIITRQPARTTWSGYLVDRISGNTQNIATQHTTTAPSYTQRAYRYLQDYGINVVYNWSQRLNIFGNESPTARLNTANPDTSTTTPNNTRTISNFPSTSNLDVISSSTLLHSTHTSTNIHTTLSSSETLNIPEQEELRSPTNQVFERIDEDNDFLNSLPSDIVIDELLPHLNARNIAHLLQTNRTFAKQILEALPINLLRNSRNTLDDIQQKDFIRSIRLFWTHSVHYPFSEMDRLAMQSTVFKAILEQLDRLTTTPNLNLAQTRFEFIELIIRCFTQSDLLKFIEHIRTWPNSSTQAHTLAYLAPLCASNQTLQSAYLKAERQINDFDDRLYAFEALFAFVPSQFLATSNFGSIFPHIQNNQNPLSDLVPYLIRQNKNDYQFSFLQYIHYAFEHNHTSRNENWVIHILNKLQPYLVINDNTRTALLNLSELIPTRRPQILRILYSNQAPQALQRPNHMPAHNPFLQHNINRIHTQYVWPLLFFQPIFIPAFAHLTQLNPTQSIVNNQEKIALNNIQINQSRTLLKTVTEKKLLHLLTLSIKLIAAQARLQSLKNFNQSVKNQMAVNQSYRSATEINPQINITCNKPSPTHFTTLETWQRNLMSWIQMLRDDNMRSSALRWIAPHLKSDALLNKYLDIALAIKNNEDRITALKSGAKRIQSQATIAYWLAYLPLNLIPLFIAWLPENTFRTELMKRNRNRIKTHLPISQSMESYNDLMNNPDSQEEDTTHPARKYLVS